MAYGCVQLCFAVSPLIVLTTANISLRIRRIGSASVEQGVACILMVFGHFMLEVNERETIRKEVGFLREALKETSVINLK